MTLCRDMGPGSKYNGLVLIVFSSMKRRHLLIAFVCSSMFIRVVRVVQTSLNVPWGRQKIGRRDKKDGLLMKDECKSNIGCGHVKALLAFNFP